MTTSKKTHWFRNTLITLIICGIVGMILAAVLYFRVDRGKTTAEASLQFSFDGAADGIGPNGIKITTEGITSDEVIQAALKASSLDGLYTTEAIRSSVTVTGVYPENLLKQMTNFESLMDFTANRELSISEYHPTLYKVSLSNEFDKSISRANLEGLLRELMNAFRQYFTEHYSYSFLREELAEEVLNRFDYVQQIAIIESVIHQEELFAQELYEKEPLFALNGKGFNDITVQLQNLSNSDIARLNSTITMNALTRDTERLITQYQFEIREQNIKLEEQQERLKHIGVLIDSYEKNEIIYLSTADSLTKIDGNSSETYDALVQERKDVSDGITQIKSRIETYQLKLSDLLKYTDEQTTPEQSVTEIASEEEEAETRTEEARAEVPAMTMTEEELARATAAAEEASAYQIAALEKDIQTLIGKLETISASFSEMLKAYNEQELNEATVSIYGYKYNTPKVLSGGYVVQVIKCAGPLCAVGFMACMVGLIRSRKKEQLTINN